MNPTTTPHAPFEHITISGDAASRGRQHGEALAGRIHTCVEVYRELFARPDAELQALAAGYRARIDAFAPEYATEIDHIARGADIEPWAVYALNARTEIINGGAPECTALYFADTCLLGQNWDWMAALEPLCALLTIEHDDGSRALTFTEPGVLAKIGMNDRGLGVCLNILHCPHGHGGVPVHVLLRAILDADDLDDARRVIRRAGLDKASHLLLGDDRGRGLGFELAATDSAELQPADGVLLHTNHYLSDAWNTPENETLTTHHRYRRAQAETQRLATRDLTTMRRILLDDHDGWRAINAPYRARDDFRGQPAGTVATLMMDLRARTMTLSRGNDPQREFATVAV